MAETRTLGLKEEELIQAKANAKKECSTIVYYGAGEIRATCGDPLPFQLRDQLLGVDAPRIRPRSIQSRSPASFDPKTAATSVWGRCSLPRTCPLTFKQSRLLCDFRL
jgi:hypothetical protein